MQFKHCVMLIIVLLTLIVPSSGLETEFQEEPKELLVGDSANFIINVMDAEKVFINYSFNMESHNVSMLSEGTQYSYHIPNIWSSGMIEYYFITVDSKGMWNSTPLQYIYVKDDGGWSSSLSHQPEQDPICKTEKITFNVSTSYHVDPVSITLFYIGDENITHRVSLRKDQDHWTSTIPPRERSGIMEYWFQMEYESGPSVNSSRYHITIENPVSASFHHHEGREGEIFHFQISLSSPVDILQATLHYEINGEPMSKPLILQEGNHGSGTWGTELKLNQGEFNYHVSIVDMNGEMDLISPSEPIRIRDSSRLPIPTIYVIAIIALTIGVVALKRRAVKVQDDIPQRSPVPTQQVNNENCTICFELIEEKEYRCTGCGASYHAECIRQLNECPICGTKPAGVDNEG
ncbi:MAG: RING-H2 finger protein [Thermoplasmata archaeon]